MNTSTASSSQASLVSNTQCRDYSASLASLQSTYGAGGQAPMQPTFSTKKQSQPKLKASRKSNSNATPSTFPKRDTYPQKDWEASFAALQSSYGFGGQAPVRPYISESTTKPSKTQSRRRWICFC